MEEPVTASEARSRCARGLRIFLRYSQLLSHIPAPSPPKPQRRSRLRFWERKQRQSSWNALYIPVLQDYIARLTEEQLLDCYFLMARVLVFPWSRNFDDFRRCVVVVDGMGMGVRRTTAKLVVLSVECTPWEWFVRAVLDRWVGSAEVREAADWYNSIFYF